MNPDPRRRLVTEREVVILEQQEEMIASEVAMGYLPFVPCGECERATGLNVMYRCLYCGIWYCEPCAEKHFGQTIAAYHGSSR